MRNEITDARLPRHRPSETRDVLGGRNGIVLPVAASASLPPDVLLAFVRVDDVAERPAGNRPDRRQHLVAHRPPPGIDHQDAVAPRLHGDVAARPDEHVDVAADRQDVDLAVIARAISPASRPRRACCGDALGRATNTRQAPQQNQAAIGCRRSLAAHPGRRRPSAGRGNVFILAMYSGYIVSAPPSLASYGVPNDR